MSDAATPPVPVAPGAAPATPPAAAPESVTLTKEAHDQLQKDAARAATNQRKADIYDRTMANPAKGHFKPQAPVTPPSAEEREAALVEEDRKASQGLTSLALDPIYRQVFDSDPTLRELFTKNPLAVLPVLAPEALDAVDAISLVKAQLDKRIKPAPVTPPTPTTPSTPATPPAGGVNVPDKAVDDAVEAARKNPNTERAIAGMIGAKIRGLKK